MSSWSYSIQWAHTVPFVHLELDNLTPSVYKEINQQLNVLKLVYKEVYAAIPKENVKMHKLVKSLNAEYVGSDDVAHVYVWEN